MDSAKAIAYGVPYGGDVWDFFCGKARPETALPVGVVVTNPASGSEMSDSCVITNEALMDKRGFSSPLGRCRFAVSNPERTFTLSPYQTAAGVADIMMHTMERYFSNDMDMPLTESIAEALLRTLKASAYKVLEDPCDYRARAQIMWGGSLSHNGLTECGMQRDWACHKMEHELSGMFDVTHGAGLTALWPTWARYALRTNVPRFVRFAVNVMGVRAVQLDALPRAADAGAPASEALASTGADAVDLAALPRAADAGASVCADAVDLAALSPAAAEVIALEGIAAMERFYRDIGMPVTLRELLGRPATDDEIVEMARRCSHDGTITVGALRVLTRADIEAIYRAAN